jgi:hypothetical protein
MRWFFGLLRKRLDFVARAAAGFAAQTIRATGIHIPIKMHTSHHYEHFGPDGVLIEEWWEHNIVVNVGLDDLLDKYFKGSTYTAAFYVGLTDGTPTAAAGDTMASHVGWVEVTAYSEATREALVLGAVSGQSVDNPASKASFSINADTTVIGGGFLTTVNTKGGATGTLYGIAAFTAGDKSLDNGDTLNVTVTLTAA